MQRIIEIIGRTGTIAAKLFVICVRIEQIAKKATGIDRKIGESAKKITARVVGINNTAERTITVIGARHTNTQKATTSEAEKSINLETASAIAVTIGMNGGHKIIVRTMARLTGVKNSVTGTGIGMIKTRTIPPGSITGTVTAKGHAGYNPTTILNEISSKQ